jgi:transcriptional regulator with XRE-family HTH domain
MKEAPHPTDIRVGQLLRTRRLLLGMSQERLGGLLGVTYQQVQKYERGANRIGSSRLHELCRILSVPVSYFFEESGVPGLAEAPAAFQHDARPALDPAEGRETMELVRAYSRIGDAQVRRRVLELARALGAARYRTDEGDAPAP